MKPYFAVYSSFLQRGYDNLIHDIALQKLSVTVLVDRAGLSSGDGPTHHGIFDVGFLSQIPNIEIFTPSCFESLRYAMTYSLSASNPIAVRYPNSGDLPVVYKRFSRITKEDDCVLRLSFSEKDSLDMLIITYGRIVTEALAAADTINQSGTEHCGIILLEKLKPYKCSCGKAEWCDSAGSEANRISGGRNQKRRGGNDPS